MLKLDDKVSAVITSSSVRGTVHAVVCNERFEEVFASGAAWAKRLKDERACDIFFYAK